ncbi:MAG: hypothetical protein A3A24_03350 [Candidatus Buchananbacteria bacterium RIFCSPLOWO2_01_FULL_46_12]|uniref:Kazal-like domain-containing protein n=1 Tax=Candidatus Buchananbacteria bacterium RIFCSPLOWO2_01_FULL_46_12 TaxID=1797546 RepID=A0A1G1YRK2_9BACT|nr:MAG: hypothetical protein A3A24_03350 [Candidatus Buchananbacteria bacterium RIFCSPLOWO2_01_FULL_46_12]
MLKITIFLLASALILAGCQNPIQPLVNVSETVNQAVGTEQQKQEARTTAIIRCQELCQETLSTDGQDFNLGPCLSNAIVADWVCDVAHSPRLAADDEPKNQCPDFRSGQASHYVEVDGNCNMIKAR